MIKKTKFEYRLPFIGDLCRHAWVLTAGFPNPHNSRVREIEADIRNPARLLKKKKKVSTHVPKLCNRGMYATAYIEEYILKHSPVNTEL